jgi:hypothetical protein
MALRIDRHRQLGAADQQWSHVAGVWNGTTLSLYVNAQFAGSVNGTGPIEVSAQPLRVST